MMTPSLSFRAVTVTSMKHACSRSERYFETGTHFPIPQEIIHTIYDVLGANLHLLSDEAELQSLPEIVSSRRRRIRFVPAGFRGNGISGWRRW